VIVTVVLIAIIGISTRWWMRGGTTTVSAQRRIAVLPLVNTGGSDSEEPYADGVTDELIGTLGKVPEFRVTGRTSVFALKEKGWSVRAIADTLGVGSVLEGSWRRMGARIRVQAQLVNATDGVVLWSETYERDAADAFAVQEDVARAIANAVHLRIIGRVTDIARRSSKDPAANELYLKGRYVFHTQIGREGILQAISFFEQAIGRDSTFARAHAGLSDALTRFVVFGYGRPQETLPRARVAAVRALALDSTLAEAHVALAHWLLVSEYDWRESERTFRKAIALDRSYTFARAPFAILLSADGRFDEAIAQLDTALALDPLAVPLKNVRGRVLVLAGRNAEAIRTLREVLVHNPRMDLAEQQLGHAYLNSGWLPLLHSLGFR